MNLRDWIYGMLGEVAESVCTGAILLLGNYTVGSPIQVRFLFLALAVDVLVAEARFLKAHGLPPVSTKPTSSPTTIRPFIQ